MWVGQCPAPRISNLCNILVHGELLAPPVPRDPQGKDTSPLATSRPPRPPIQPARTSWSPALSGICSQAPAAANAFLASKGRHVVQLHPCCSVLGKGNDPYASFLASSRRSQGSFPKPGNMHVKGPFFGASAGMPPPSVHDFRQRFNTSHEGRNNSSIPSNPCPKNMGICVMGKMRFASRFVF